MSKAQVKHFEKLLKTKQMACEFESKDFPSQKYSFKTFFEILQCYIKHYSIAEHDNVKNSMLHSIGTLRRVHQC